MIKTLLKSHYLIGEIEGKKYNPSPIPIVLEPGITYCLKSNVFNIQRGEKGLECELSIRDVENNEITQIFTGKNILKFNTKDFKPTIEEIPDVILSNIRYKLKDYSIPKFIDCTLYALFNASKLKTDKNLKDSLKKLMDKYIKKDYEAVIIDSGIVAEYIATQLYKKRVKKTPKDFRAAVNFLVSLKMSKRMKINYNYIGSLIWPVYYMRNQRSHPNPLIDFKKEEAGICIRNLGKILNVLKKLKVTF